MLIFTKKIDFILNNIITDIYTKMTIVDPKSYNNYLIDNNFKNIIGYVKTINTPEDYINYFVTNNIKIILIDFVKILTYHL